MHPPPDAPLRGRGRHSVLLSVTFWVQATCARQKILSRPQLLGAAERLRETPIKIAYILLGIALTQHIDEPFIGLVWLVGELDLVLLIKLCNPLANCRLALNAQTLR